MDFFRVVIEARAGAKENKQDALAYALEILANARPTGFCRSQPDARQWPRNATRAAFFCTVPCVAQHAAYFSVRFAAIPSCDRETTARGVAQLRGGVHIPSQKLSEAKRYEPQKYFTLSRASVPPTVDSSTIVLRLSKYENRIQKVHGASGQIC